MSTNLSRVIIAGEDSELSTAFREHQIAVERITAHVTADTLAAADVETAELLILTTTSDATAVPIAKEMNPEIRVVFYATESMPEFVKGQVDLAISPELLDPDVVVEELAGGVTDPP